MTHFDRFSNRARVEPNTPRSNYRYNSQFEEQQSRRGDVVSALVVERNDALSRFDMLQRHYNAAMARFEAQQRNNEELTSLLDASRRQVDQLYTTANALQRELQIATLGSRACADAVAQSTSCMAELQRFHQQYDELQQKNNKLQQELHIERQLRRAADSQLNHQAARYQDMKARAASDVHVIGDLRSEVAKLNNKIAQLEGAAQVRELRITVRAVFFCCALSQTCFNSRWRDKRRLLCQRVGAQRSRKRRDSVSSLHLKRQQRRRHLLSKLRC